MERELQVKCESFVQIKEVRTFGSEMKKSVRLQRRGVVNECELCHWTVFLWRLRNRNGMLLINICIAEPKEDNNTKSSTSSFPDGCKH